MVKKCVKHFLEPFKGKKLPQKWRKSEISRWSNQVENVIFRLPTFFSKVSKIFPIGHIAFIFSLRCVFIVILDPWKIWRAYDKTSEKYLGKSTPPPNRDLGGGLHVYCIFNQSLPDVREHIRLAKFHKTKEADFGKTRIEWFLCKVFLILKTG